MNEQNLTDSLRQSADRIETSPAPTNSMISNERHRKTRQRTWGVAAAASIGVVLSIGTTAVLLGDSDRATESVPTTDGAQQSLNASELALAEDFERQMRSNIEGTYLGGLASPITAPKGTVECSSGRLLVVRGVWKDDANFAHSGPAVMEGYPAPPPDGPMKATFVVVETDSGKECLRGATFRAVGAAPEETLLSGVRPDDPTGEFDPASVTAGNVAPESPEEPLEGDWLVVSLVGTDGRTLLTGRYATGEKRMILNFTDGQLAGTTGCNSVFGTYINSARDLTFPHDRLGGTLVGCSDEPPLVQRLLAVRHISGTGNVRYLHADSWMIIAKLDRVPAG